MRTVFLLTGFNNWGKTTLINDLFVKGRFMKDRLHRYANHDFCVIPQSNDDLGEEGYIYAHDERVALLKKQGIAASNIFSAFCPTKEPNNYSPRIITKLYSNDKVYIIPIEYKWCGNAKLRLKEISSFYSNQANVTIKPITSNGSQKTELNNLISQLL